MTRRVRLLDEVTINQIAAGEVVERPASVVKELVENALDAGARRIQVELRGGGLDGIEVVDDGCGMSPDDLRLAVERHATSKIASAADLEAVTSLGFRGEALPSIAAVSRLEIVTREPEALAGARLAVRGGREESFEEAGCPPGTRVAVTGLFHNTPARRKYLKGPAVELDRALRAVTALALARPGVAFRVRHNGREVLATPGTGRLDDAVAAAYGRDLAASLIPVEGEEGGMRLHGYVAAPVAARASRAHQHFFVNGRAASGYPLPQALEDAFSGLVMTHRHPVCFLHLELDPRRVDVNVHPAKLRVRFQDEGAVARLLRRAVGEALARADLAPHVGAGDAGRLPAAGPAAEPLVLDGWEPEWRLAEVGAAYAVPPAATGADGVREAAAAAVLPLPEPVPEPAGAGRRWPALRLIGRVADTYILAEGEDGLYIIDQHAAHERLNFEAFRHRRAAGAGAGQPLAAPLPVAVGPGGVAVWEAHRERVEALGFLAEPFGGDTLLLREVPALLAGDGCGRAFRDLLDRLAEGPGSEWRPEEELAWLASRSCKASVRARDPLSVPEMEALLAALRGAENPFTCPHGRPTVLRFGHRDLERLFRRV